MPTPITVVGAERIVECLLPISATSVLSIGPTPCWLAQAFAGLAVIDELPDRAIAATTQIDRRYDVVVLTTTGCFGDTTSDRALLHTAVLHLQRDGHLALIRPAGNQLPLAAGQRLDLIHTYRTT